MRTRNRSTDGSPARSSRSSGPALSWTLPNRSIHQTSACSPSVSTAAAETTAGRRPLGSIKSPSSARSIPQARWAATDANTSRPSNVVPWEGRCQAGSLNETARSAPPTMATAGANKPLSGPTRTDCPPPTSTATPRRVVPTPGSTTARTTPGHRYWALRARARPPARTSWEATPWVTSTIRTWGAMDTTTEWTTPTNSSSVP